MVLGVGKDVIHNRFVRNYVQYVKVDMFHHHVSSYTTLQYTVQLAINETFQVGVCEKASPESVNSDTHSIGHETVVGAAFTWKTTAHATAFAACKIGGERDHNNTDH